MPRDPRPWLEALFGLARITFFSGAGVPYRKNEVKFKTGRTLQMGRSVRPLEGVAASEDWWMQTGSSDENAV